MPAADGTPSEENMILNQHHSAQAHPNHPSDPQPIEIQSVQKNISELPTKANDKLHTIGIAPENRRSV
jgi:hypothetical protein